MGYQAIIGRSEKIDIVDQVLNIPTKIDTGAYRSAIHCKSVKLVTKPNNMPTLMVELLGHPCSPVVYPMEFEEFETVVVTNSFGHEEERYEVRLRVKLASKIFTTSFTLADRSSNLFPILAGRKLIRDRFVVDVSKSGVDRIRLKQDYGIHKPIDEEDLED